MAWNKISDSLYSNDTTPHLLYLENGSWKIKKTNYDTDKDLSLDDLFQNPIYKSSVSIIGQIIEINPLSKITIPTNFLLCDGQIITDPDSPNINKRVKNLKGSTLNLSGSGTTGQNFITISSNDINAINVGDLITGTGIPLNSQVNEIDTVNNRIYITNPNTAAYSNGKYATVNLSGNVTSFNVIGKTFSISSNSILWDTMQGHNHEIFNNNNDFIVGGSWTIGGSGSWNRQQTPLDSGRAIAKTNVSDGTNQIPRIANETKTRSALIDFYECIK